MAGSDHVVAGIAEIDLSTDEEQLGCWDFFLYLRDPLRYEDLTTFLAFVKESGLTTENATRKISVLGYAIDRSRL